MIQPQQSRFHTSRLVLFRKESQQVFEWWVQSGDHERRVFLLLTCVRSALMVYFIFGKTDETPILFYVLNELISQKSNQTDSGAAFL